MTVVRTAHTADLAPGVLAAVRALLDGAYEDEAFDDHDWDHTLGGVHALALHRRELVGHAAVVQRRLVHGGRALRTGYVEGVAVHADHRGRGHGAALMAALEPVVASAYDLGALASTEGALGFYAARGWQRWRGPTWALTPDGPQRTEDADGYVLVLPQAAPLDPGGDLTCDWRDGDVW